MLATNSRSHRNPQDRAPERQVKVLVCDPFDEARILAQLLVSAVAAALGRTPLFDGLQVWTAYVVVVNAGSAEQQTWSKEGRSIVGPDVRVVFVTRPLRPKATGISMTAARGRGTLDFKHFECGCRAAQIPGEDDWQLIGGTHCRFAANVHQPGRWPIDAIVHPTEH